MAILSDQVDEAEAMVVERASLVDEVTPVGRIQNCRLQKPKFASAFTSPKASTALMAKGASQSGSQLTVQSSVLSEYPAGPSQSAKTSGDLSYVNGVDAYC